MSYQQAALSKSSFTAGALLVLLVRLACLRVGRELFLSQLLHHRLGPRLDVPKHCLAQLAHLKAQLPAILNAI